METRLFIYRNNGLYQLACFIGNQLYLFNSNIASILGINYFEYEHTLNNNGGTFYTQYRATYFKNEEDAIKAKDIIESIRLINNLVNEG